ncbi:MAG: sigma 54-interacting transcriptional regulator [Thermodesulfovibrionales bacterium]
MVQLVMNENPPSPASADRNSLKFSILYEIALTVGKSLDLKTILDDVLNKVMHFMGVDGGVIYVVNGKTLELVPVSFQNLSNKVVKDLSENKVKVGECMCGTIAQCNSEVIIFRNASDDPRFTRGLLRKEGMDFYAGLPLKAKGKVVGVLCIITHTPYTPDPEMLDILRAATLPIGLAIENALIFETTRKEADATMRYFNFEGIVSSSPSMLAILDLVKKIADVSSSILIYGESGTGKELIARSIHFNSTRREKPFVTINCAALPEGLLESELFGYLRGAFTGALNDKKGLFEAADGGTLFLDEVEAMTKNLQVKLLRVLQDGTFLKVGGTQPLTVDVRIIAATNEKLANAVREKMFRDDLYYRLNVIRIELPPLRERTEDIPLLVWYFINKFNKKVGKNIRKISDGALEALMLYPWPGNIRELENTIERAVVIAGSHEIRREDLPEEISDAHFDYTKDWTLEKMEKEHIMKVLLLTGGNKTKTAKLLGLDTSTLWRKLKTYHNHNEA